MPAMATVGLVYILLGALGVLVVSVALALRARWLSALNTGGRAFIVGLIVGLLGGGVLLRAVADRRAEATWHAQARVWARMPLRVSSGPDLRQWSPQLEGAMRMWNLALGCEVFEGADGGRADVRVVFTLQGPCDSTASVLDRGDAAGTYYCSDGTADVEVQRLETIATAYRIFAHELGHVLGLGHDHTGLMAESITSTADEVAPSAKDRDLLAAWYCTDGGVRSR